MAKSKKGRETKARIYEASKYLFYHYGYRKTTLLKISERADVPVGLISYYFKSKDHIVSMIYEDFMGKIDDLIEASCKNQIDNAILYHAVLSRVYYQIILSDPNNTRFYRGFLKQKSNNKVLHSLIGKRYLAYLKDFNIKISDTDFEIILNADFGARREFFLYYFDHPDEITIQSVVTFTNGVVPRLLKLNQQKIDAILEKSYHLYKTLDFEDIVFLSN